MSPKQATDEPKTDPARPSEGVSHIPPALRSLDVDVSGTEGAGIKLRSTDYDCVAADGNGDTEFVACLAIGSS